ncbi:MAG: RlmF-related methyltransferase, partial [Gammaproteobacteria bacterium]|nr:RlmF-related methyltransferase [Gammaproteobacteria bacterium]
MKPTIGRSQRAASAPKAKESKASLHPANPHQAGYDMQALQQSYPVLSPFLLTTPRGEQSIDFSDPQAVKTLNQALLAHHYQLPFWDVPDGYLCP